ncbi:hypothetical protein [Streptomyces olivaceoviridis]|uniref:hypothetical protein n=1 Tax=Streptomyces olivaceoviridis TaxID=1921 RepID=UPI0037897D1E
MSFPEVGSPGSVACSSSQEELPRTVRHGEPGTAPWSAGGYAGSNTGFAASPPFFSQRSSLAMASEKEWATV